MLCEGEQTKKCYDCGNVVIWFGPQIGSIGMDNFPCWEDGGAVTTRT
jgi:hypothetical protein